MARESGKAFKTPAANKADAQRVPERLIRYSVWSWNGDGRLRGCRSFLVKDAPGPVVTIFVRHSANCSNCKYAGDESFKGVVAASICAGTLMNLGRTKGATSTEGSSTGARPAPAAGGLTFTTALFISLSSPG
jgi:hypothetical protein